MKRFLLIATGLCILQAATASKIGEWKSHFSYNHVTQLAQQGDEIFALADKALFSVNKEDGAITCYDKQVGLNGSSVCQIASNEAMKILFIAYTNGQIDLLDNKGTIYPLNDLRDKDINSDKTINHIYMDGERAYCSMSFGVMAVNLRKREIADSYYIGENGSAVNVLATTILGDSIYAVSENTLYAASKRDNLLDYNHWHSCPLPAEGRLTSVAAQDGMLYLLQSGKPYVRNGGTWHAIATDKTFTTLRQHSSLYAIADFALYRLEGETIQTTPVSHFVADVLLEGNNCWVAGDEAGVVQYTTDGAVNFYLPEGPAVNRPYRMKVAHNRLYVVPGSRWAVNDMIAGNVMVFDGTHWTNVTNNQLYSQLQHPVYDLMNVAVDPQDPEHIFVTSYGQGLIELQGSNVVKWYIHTNSPIKSAIDASSPAATLYNRLDGAMFDEKGDLWFLNAGSLAKPIHVVTRSQIEAAHHAEMANWYTHDIFVTSTNQMFSLETPQEVVQDTRNSHYKWIPVARYNTGLLLIDDRGDAENNANLTSYFRSSWTDQDGNQVRPEFIYCMAQDHNGDVWIGTEEGIIPIPSNVDFRTSDACVRIKIARNDGTNLADYLLGSERINAIVVDGANRKWIGTEGSGLYLMSEDGTETIEHFTTDNSPLPSNKIMSLAIEPRSGVVYVGTDGGLMSYQSDATEPLDDFSTAYAYPNPVRSEYEGVITLTGLMEESTVKIIDAGGNLVYETLSNGGMATWNGKNHSGKRVTSGVYTALCHSGSSHQEIKILIMH